jgi:hypothetical protein
MNQKVLLGRGIDIVEVPQQAWEGHMEDAPEHVGQRLSFMTPDHHRVRYFVVSEIALRGTVLSPKVIAEALNLSIDKTRHILDELEKNLFFLFRPEADAIVWSYPVTAEKTPHRITLDSGERLYGA